MPRRKHKAGARQQRKRAVPKVATARALRRRLPKRLRRMTRPALDFVACTDPLCPHAQDQDGRFNPKKRGPHAHPVFAKDQ